MRDHNDLAYWFPPLYKAELPVPKTTVIHTTGSLFGLLDGEEVPGFEELVAEVVTAGDKLGWPCFLRTGHGSGKHNWSHTCYLERPGNVGQHIVALVEWSATAGLFGLPTATWVVRELLKTEPLFKMNAYGEMPYVREFRVFVKDVRGTWAIDHFQPYWPLDAVAQGRPDTMDWEDIVRESWQVSERERVELNALALAAARAQNGGSWSVDILKDADGKWWITDMADAEQSFRWEPEA